MIYILIAIVVLYVAILFLVWKINVLNQQNHDAMQVLQAQEQLTHLQEEHLKQTLQLMQDLAKKMHIQQEVLDKTTQRMTQVEVQNAELIRLLQQNFSDR